MALSIFEDRSHTPTDADLAAALGRSLAHWRAVQAHLAPCSIEWGYTSRSTGWGVRLKQSKRTILYLTPCRGFFLASFVLGEKAVRAAQGAGLPEAVLATIESAPRYAEGRGFRLEVRTAKDLRTVERLAAVKIAS